MPTLEQAVRGYRKLREAKKALQDQHKEQLAPYNEQMQKLEAWFLVQLAAQGADHVGTESGTVYKSVVTKAVVRDWGATLEFIKEHDLWGMLEHRLSKTAVEEYAEAQGDVPPGVEITKETFARVRK